MVSLFRYRFVVTSIHSQKFRVWGNKLYRYRSFLKRNSLEEVKSDFGEWGCNRCQEQGEGVLILFLGF